MPRLSRLRPAVRRLLLAAAVAILAAVAPATAWAEPALWVVKGPHATVYLFGTIHLLRPQADWKSRKIEKALASAQDLTLEITEVDDPSAMIPLVQKYGVDPTHPLSGKLNAAENAKLDATYVALGLQPHSFDPLRPWLAGLQLSVLPLQKQGYDPNAGVDRLLKQEAAARGEPVRAFETAEQQIRYFADMPETQQLDFFREALNDSTNLVGLLDQLETAWAAGDVGAIARYLNQDMKKDDAALYDLLLTSRNKAFAAQIAEMLKGRGTRFVAIGAGHLAGEDSVQVQLAKMGIKARRL